MSAHLMLRTACNLHGLNLKNAYSLRNLILFLVSILRKVSMLLHSCFSPLLFVMESYHYIYHLSFSDRLQSDYPPPYYWHRIHTQLQVCKLLSVLSYFLAACNFGMLCLILNLYPLQNYFRQLKQELIRYCYQLPSRHPAYRYLLKTVIAHYLKHSVQSVV